MAQGVSGKQPRNKEVRCADFNKDIQEKRRKRRSKPQPWILLKFAVLLTLGITGFTTYVYVVRFCVPMVTRKAGAMGDRAFGSESILGKMLDIEGTLTLSRLIAVVFLVPFGVLLILMMWTYVKVRVAAPQFVIVLIRRRSV